MKDLKTLQEAVQIDMAYIIEKNGKMFVIVALDLNGPVSCLIVYYDNDDIRVIR